MEECKMMSWFNHTPTEQGLYWFFQSCEPWTPRIKKQTKARMCEIVFTEYENEQHTEMFFLGTEYSQDFIPDSHNWLCGPIEPPAFEVHHDRT